MMVNSNIEKSCGHDWTAYMIVSAFGDIYYDKVPTLKYRRTGNNVSGGGKGFIAFQIWISHRHHTWNDKAGVVAELGNRRRSSPR